MGLMTSQPAFPFPPTGDGTSIGAAAHLVEDEQGGQVFIHGLLSFVWMRQTRNPAGTPQSTC